MTLAPLVAPRMEPVTQRRSVSLEVEVTMEAVPAALECAAYVSAPHKYSLP